MNKSFYSLLIAASMLLSSFSSVLAEEPAIQAEPAQQVISETVEPTEEEVSVETAETEDEAEVSEPADDTASEEVSEPAEDAVSEEEAEPAADTTEETEEESANEEKSEEDASEEEVVSDAVIDSVEDNKPMEETGIIEVTLPKETENEAELMSPTTATPSVPTSPTYEPFAVPTQSGYFNFYEDFSELTTFLGTELGAVDFSSSSIARGTPLATRPDNVSWSVSNKRGSYGSVSSKAHFNLDDDTMGLIGGGANVAMLFADLTPALPTGMTEKDIPQEYQEITFETGHSQRAGGVTLFINGSDNTYIWVGTRNEGNPVNGLPGNGGGVAFVAFIRNGSVADNEYFTQSGFSTNVRWTVKIEDGVISWKAENSSKTWEDSAPFDQTYIDNCQHLMGFAGAGDGGASTLKKIRYITGSFYTPDIIEPTEALYSDVMETAVAMTDTTGAPVLAADGRQIYKLAEPVDIKRVEFMNYTGTSFELSEDNVTWDVFDSTYVQNTTDADTTNDEHKGTWIEVTSTLSRWVNTVNTKRYQYVKKPVGEVMFWGMPTGQMRVFENVSKNSVVKVRKMDASNEAANDRYLYLSDRNGWSAGGFTISSDDTNYITVDGNSTYTNAGRAQVRGKKETWRKDEEYKADPANNQPLYVTVDADGAGTSGAIYKVHISVQGPLSDLQIDPSQESAYVLTQQQVFDDLNAKIAQANASGLVVDIDAVKNFFLLTNVTPSVNNLDALDANDFRNVDRDFARRVMSYGSFSAGTTIEELEAACDILTREAYVGELNNLNDDVVPKLNDDGTPVLGADGVTPVNYTTNELLAMAIEKNRVLLDLPVGNKYYEENGADSMFASKIRDYLVDYSQTKMTAGDTNTFTSQKHAQDMINEAIIMTVLKNSDSSTYLTEMIDTYRVFMGFSTAEENAKLDEIIGDLNATNIFAQSLNAAKSTMTSSAQIKTFVMNYSVPTVNPNAPAAPSRPVSSGGGGGGMSSVKAPVNVVKQPDNTVVEKEQVFGDVPVSYWGYEAIRYMFAKQVVSGYGDGNYLPENLVTKAELIKMIINIFKPDVEIPEDYVIPFADVAKDAWYYTDIAKANILGIFNGTGENAEPDTPVTRQEMTTIIFRMIEKSGKTLSREVEIQKFNDEAEIAEWAFTPIAKMQAAGIINGDNGSFNPNGNSTRAMAAQILFKTMQGFEKPAEEVVEEEAAE